MHDLALFEVDRSYHRVQGKWHAHDDFELTGYSQDRHSETLRIVAPSETLARAFVEQHHKTGFGEEAKVTIDATRRVHLDGMVSVTW